jgi:cell division protein FtsL
LPKKSRKTNIKFKNKRGGKTEMSKALIIQNGWFESGMSKNKLSFNEKRVSFVESIFQRKNSRNKKVVSGGAKISLISLGLVLLIALFLAGIFYLYQVNSLATQGFEIKKIENNIQTMEKEGKQLQIKEIELRSMNNIEKATKELNLVNSSNVTYIEIAGPVAMK